MNERMTWEMLYERYATDVYRFALWLCANVADAEDITSETFVRAWGSLDAARTETVKAYLFTIARNLYLGQQRRKDTAVLTPNITDSQPGPAQLSETRLELTAVWQLMQTWPEADRAALILRVYDQLPYSEIARVLGISLSAAKVKVHRARLKLTLLAAEDALTCEATASEPTNLHELEL